MKRLIYLVLCLLVVIGCKNDDDVSETDEVIDLAAALLGEWRDVSYETCDTGIIFNVDGAPGTVRFTDFDLCDQPCASITLGGTYTLINNFLVIQDIGLGQFNNEIVIENDTLTILGNDLEDGTTITSVYERLDCNN